MTYIDMEGKSIVNIPMAIPITGLRTLSRSPFMICSIDGDQIIELGHSNEKGVLTFDQEWLSSLSPTAQSFVDVITPESQDGVIQLHTEGILHLFVVKV